MVDNSCVNIIAISIVVSIAMLNDMYVACAMAGVGMDMTIALPKNITMTMETTIVITKALAITIAVAMGIALSVAFAMVVAFVI